MIYIIAKTETGYKDLDGDWALWNNLGRAYGMNYKHIHLVEDPADILDYFRSAPGVSDIKKVFLEPPFNEKFIDHEFINLKDYKHPEECVYIFGNTPAHNIRFIQPEDDIVSVRMVNFSSRIVFGISIASIVLYDRWMKIWQEQ